jgi:hypothetical protein
MKKLPVFILAALTVSVSFAATSAHAAPAPATNTSGQALEIAPPVINLVGNPGQTLKTQISLRDVSSSKLIVSGQVNDFVASGEDGTPKILLDSSEPNPYSIRSWVSPLSDLTLNPRQIENLPVTIKIPANAAPGGYYGVVRFTATPPELKSTGVSLSASLGALVLLRVNGQAKESLSVEELSINKAKDGKPGTLFESTPINFVVRLKNTGNVHEQPTGQVAITDMFGKKIANVNVNSATRNILPQSIRKFDEPLDSSIIGNKILFGLYHANLKMTYGASKQTVTSSMTFWIIPYKLIGIGIAVLVGGFIALRIMVRRYNSHIISKAQGSKPKSKRK